MAARAMRTKVGHPYSFYDKHGKVKCRECGDKVERGSLLAHADICRATHDEGGSG